MEVKTMLTRWDPFQEMLNLRRTVDRLFDNANPDHEWQPTQWGLAVDVVENKDDFMTLKSRMLMTLLPSKVSSNRKTRSKRTNITCASAAMVPLPEPSVFRHR
jgi:hypothetical protein